MRRVVSIMNDLDEQLKEFYQARELPEQRTETILLQARSLRPVRFRFPLRWLAAAVAVAVVLLFGGVITNPVLSRSSDNSSKMADEIAIHHLAGKKPTVLSESYDVVQDQLAKLTFSIMPDRPRLLQDYKLVGAKYCSLQGNLAAQVKLADREHGALHTLYVTELTGDCRIMKPEIFYRSGVIVDIWSDDDRLFALASDTTTH